MSSLFIRLTHSVCTRILPSRIPLQLFSLQEVSQKIFDQTPGSILQEMRVARYVKHQITDEDVLADLETATIPIDGGAVPSATMLPSDTLLALLADKRRPELVQPLQLALLKFSSQARFPNVLYEKKATRHLRIAPESAEFLNFFVSSQRKMDYM